MVRFIWFCGGWVMLFMGLYPPDNYAMVAMGLVMIFTAWLIPKTW